MIEAMGKREVIVSAPMFDFWIRGYGLDPEGQPLPMTDERKNFLVGRLFAPTLAVSFEPNAFLAKFSAAKFNYEQATEVIVRAGEAMP